MGIASMVIGIVALSMCWIPLVNIPLLVMAMVGIGLGIAALARAKPSGRKASAAAGLIMSGFALVIGVAIDTAFVTWTFDEDAYYSDTYDYDDRLDS